MEISFGIIVQTGYPAEIYNSRTGNSELPDVQESTWNFYGGIDFGITLPV